MEQKGTQEEVQKVASEAKERSKIAAEEQKRTAVHGMDRFADSLHKVANQFDHDGQSGVADYTRKAASGIENIASKVRSKDTGELIGDIESYARQNPAIFLMGSVAIGFGLSLLMRAAQSASSEGSEQTVH